MIRDARDVPGLNMADVEEVERILSEEGIQDYIGLAEKIINVFLSTRLAEFSDLEDENENLRATIMYLESDLHDAQNETYEVEDKLNGLKADLGRLQS